VTDFRRSTDSGKTWTPRTPRLAFVSERTGNREIYTANEQGNNLQRVTGNPAADENPAWSPAWTRLAFQSNRSGNWDIFSLKAECTPAQAECDLHQQSVPQKKSVRLITIGTKAKATTSMLLRLPSHPLGRYHPMSWRLCT